MGLNHALHSEGPHALAAQGAGGSAVDMHKATVGAAKRGASSSRQAAGLAAHAVAQRQRHAGDSEAHVAVAAAHAAKDAGGSQEG